LPDLRLEASERFNISPHRARALIRAALRRLALEGKAIRPGSKDPGALALAIRRREFLFHESLQKGDRRTALAAEKDGSKLRGLYAADAMAPDEDDAYEITQAIETELAQIARAMASQGAPPKAPHLREPSAPAAS
jgi:hypothetical protein